MLVLKIIFLHLYWFLVVKLGLSEYGNTLIPISIGLAILNFYIYKPSIEIQKYILLLIFFISWAIFQDTILFELGGYKTQQTPYWMISLWAIFVCYYGDLFDRVKSLSLLQQVIMGLFGGLFAYWAGAKYSGIIIEPTIFYSGVGLSWALFFPLSIKLCYEYSFLDKVLDYSIFYSFDKGGFLRRSRFFTEPKASLAGKNILVTGGTSGIGHSCAKQLVEDGANVYVTGRDTTKGQKVERDGLKFLKLDLADWDEVVKFCKLDITFDHVVLNAGGMPETKHTNSKGVESQFASQLVGHYLLAMKLKESGKLAKFARFVWVSSGGMYLKKLDLNELFENNNYDKVSTYANVKRAQVAFVKELISNPEWKDFTHVSMHPGWVYTKGIADALPKFSSFMDKRLRSADQGADTISWLLKCSRPSNGDFYFDRMIVSPYITQGYIPSLKQMEELNTKINQYLAQYS